MWMYRGKKINVEQQLEKVHKGSTFSLSVLYDFICALTLIATLIYSIVGL